MKSRTLIIILCAIFSNPYFISAQDCPKYDPEHVASHIIMGESYIFMSDKIKYTRERTPDRYLITYDMDPRSASKKLDKFFKGRKAVFGGSTPDGLIFTIYIEDKNDRTKSSRYITFHVDGHTKKITEIEILLGDE